MRVIHFADLHIGVETYGRPLPDRAWSSRIQDFLDAFDELVEFAIADHTDAVIFAGDAFKSREPGQTQQREFARRIRRLSDAGVAVFLLVGNHDLPNAEGRAHVLEIYRTLQVPGVYVGDASHFAGGNFRPLVMETRSGPLQIASVPWPQVSRFLAARPDLANATIDQLLSEVEHEIGNLIDAQAGLVDPAVPAVLVGHVSVNEWMVRERKGSEQFMTVGVAPTILRSALCSGAFDYVALGHHHNHIDLEMDTPAFYAGSMQRVDFGEAGQPKGFMRFELDPAKPRGQRIGGSGVPRLREVRAREFVPISVRPKELDPTAEVLAAIERRSIDESIVRVDVGDEHSPLSPEQAQNLRLPDINKALERAHYNAGVRPVLANSTRRALPEGFEFDASSPIDALDLYFRSQNMEEARRERLKQAARDLLATTGDH